MTISLVQAIKNFRESQKAPPPDLLMQNVTWDLDTCFVGEPLNARLVRRISEYVDCKLDEYAAIMDSQAATRSFTARVRGPASGVDEHIANSRSNSSFVRFNTTEQGMQPYVDTEVVEIPNVHITPVAQRLVELGESERLNRPDPSVAELQKHGMGDEDEESEEESSDSLPLSTRIGVPTPTQSGLHVKRVPDDSRDMQDAMPDCADEATPYPQLELTGHKVTRLPESTVEGFKANYRLAENQPETVNDAAIQSRAEYFGVRNHTVLRLDSPGGAMDHTDPPRGWLDGGDQVDSVVSTNGMIPSSPNRTKDSFVRIDPEQERSLRPLHVGTNPFRSPLPEHQRVKDRTSYITSYNIDHTTLQISARVITAPASLKIDMSTWFDICDSDCFKSVKDVVRGTIKANLSILMGNKDRSPCRHNNRIMVEAEQVALETLRELITEDEYRRYVKYGFLTVRGSSGDIYQVFRDRAHTVVWRGGRVIEEICVRLRHDVNTPPTDNVIAFLTMISADEEEFKQIGNRYKKSLEAA